MTRIRRSGKSGFNNLDLEISLQCANYITHRLKIDNDLARLETYEARMKDLAGEVDIARHLIVGRVHDALNNLKFAYDNLTYVKASEATVQSLEAAKSYVTNTRRFIRTLRDKVQVDKKISIALSSTTLRPFFGRAQGPSSRLPQP